jgi:hypothetical protein
MTDQPEAVHPRSLSDELRQIADQMTASGDGRDHWNAELYRLARAIDDECDALRARLRGAEAPGQEKTDPPATTRGAERVLELAR